MKSIRISESLTLPPDAATQTFAVVARKRVGKTYTASVMAEEMIAAGIPIAVLDPTGAWWGLRSMADGKEGLPVIIIGGAHGDVPLDEHGGRVIADLMIDHPGFYIIDFTTIESQAAQDRFATEFGGHFYKRKQLNKFPIHLFIDEADCFMPQQPFENQRRMLGVYDTIIRRGGISGIGVTMITQRPAVLNKNALTQAETMIALQISGSQDVDAIEHWMRIHGSKEQREEVISSLATLQRGECWVWSPSWLQVLKRVRIRQRRTFNSSATPEMGDRLASPKLAQVDIEKLGSQIQSAIQKEKDNNPLLLKKRVQELERELKTVQGRQSDQVKKPLITESQIKKLEQLNERADKIITNWTSIIQQCSQSLKAHKTPVERVKQFLPARPAIVKQNTPTIADGEFRPGKCALACLAVLSQFPDGCLINKLALLAGYSVSGGFRNELSALRTSGCIVGGNTELMRITEHGLTFGPYQELPSGEERLDFFRNHPAFGLAERKIIDALRDNEQGLAIADLAAASGYEVSGGFRNNLSTLRTAGVIIGRNTEVMSLNPEMFT